MLEKSTIRSFPLKINLIWFHRFLFDQDNPWFWNKAEDTRNGKGSWSFFTTGGPYHTFFNCISLILSFFVQINGSHRCPQNLLVGSGWLLHQKLTTSEVIHITFFFGVRKEKWIECTRLLQWIQWVKIKLIFDVFSIYR